VESEEGFKIRFVVGKANWVKKIPNFDERSKFGKFILLVFYQKFAGKQTPGNLS
jgi:hypothetical protein